MSTYRFYLRNYHAIKEADIKINGITVLSGINGCGKSTLSRWLYYMVNGASAYENLLYDKFIRNIAADVERNIFISGDMRRSSIRSEVKSGQYAESISTLREIKDKIHSTLVYGPKQVEQILSLYRQSNEIFADLLETFLLESTSLVRKERVMRFLNIGLGIDDVEGIIDHFMERSERFAEKSKKQLYDNILTRSTENFFELIRPKYRISEDCPEEIKLFEDNVSIVESDHISDLFNLSKAIYVDTPMSITTDFSGNIFWERLKEMLYEDKNIIEDKESKKILLKIKKLLGGEIILEKDGIVDNSLKYISSDNKVNIDINNVATGFKTFSYLQRLLQNGYLKSDSLLMIDEPEAHLHPQWIVEFARLLVLLNKHIGLKIIIASHNPDMVAAIHDIAEKEDIISMTNFYTTIQDKDNPHQYIYEDLGSNIDKIFSSFNIALERIDYYGGHSDI